MLTSNEAKELYDSIRTMDSQLSAIEGRVIEWIKEITSYRAIDVGSFGLGLNLLQSDLDLAIGVPHRDLARVLDVLGQNGKLKGVRKTTSSSVRHVFLMPGWEVNIDLGVLQPEDFALLQCGLARIRHGMSLADKIEHVWRKHQLRQAGLKEEYARTKLEPYQKFCPEFHWIPILE